MARKKKFKKEKKKVIFNEDDRVEYLTGFRKRNLERRLKAKEKLNNMLKKEKIRIKRNKKEALNQALISQRQVPEIEHLLKPVTIDLPEHTVTISEYEDFNSVPVTNPLHTIFSTTHEDDDLSQKVKKDEVEVEKIRKLIKEMKAKRAKPPKNSKTALLAKKMQRKSDKIKAKRLVKELSKNSKSTKKKHVNKKHIVNKKNIEKRGNKRKK